MVFMMIVRVFRRRKFMHSMILKMMMGYKMKALIHQMMNGMAGLMTMNWELKMR